MALWHRWQKSKIDSSLRTRLMLLVIISLLPAFGLLLYTAFAQRNLVENEARNDALHLVRSAALDQKHLIVAARQLLTTLARLPVTRSSNWNSQCGKILADLRQLHPYYANIGIADTRGNVRCSAIPPKKAVNIADRMYFQEAMGKKAFAVGSYQVGRITGRSAINAGYPVHNEQGVVHGVVYVAIDLLTWLVDLAQALKLVDGTTVLVVSDEGTVLARHPESETWIGKTLPDSPLIGRVLTQGGEGSFEEPGLDGVSRLYVHAPIHTSRDGPTYLIAGIPTDEVYRNVNGALLNGLYLLAFIAILVLAVGWYGARFLVLKPTHSLIRAADRLGRGDFTTRTNLPHAQGEFGKLATSFDRMAENLERDDNELRRVNRALKTLSAGNRTMLRATDEQALLDEMCRVFVEQGGYGIALVLYRQNDAAKSLRPMAQAGHPGGLAALQECRLGWGDDELGRNPAGLAVRTSEPQLTRDLRNESSVAGWRAVAPACSSNVSIPLRVHGETIGAVLLCAVETDAFDPDELKLLDESVHDLAYGIETLRTRAAHEAANEALRQLTHYDGVTGLPNETHFSESLHTAINDAERTNSSFTMLQLDIDRLREINDALGFNQGDELLRQYGRRLRSALPEKAVAARLRGDEFAALLPGTDIQTAVTLADRLGKELAQPYQIADLALDVPVHMGIVGYPDHGTTPHDLFRHMNLAVQLAKKKDTSHAIFEREQRKDPSRRLSMASELRSAIEGGNLRLHLQPKVEMASGRVCGAEGLVRWQHEIHGLIPPGEFIGLAESTGLIKPLTEWVIEAALRLIHGWRQGGLELPIAVNLSARNLREDELIAKIRRLQAAWSPDTCRLELEITESAIMEDAEFSMQMLHHLRDIGIPLYIDDFGTGYSSLSYLQKLPVHAIKIDQSFVRRMASSRDSAVIVQSTIDLAHDLGRQVVAEGIEDRETWDRLTALGCDVAQGYFISKPMPAEDFPRWVDRFQPPSPIQSR